jgi:hypothetical protein
VREPKDHAVWQRQDHEGLVWQLLERHDLLRVKVKEEEVSKSDEREVLRRVRRVDPDLTGRVTPALDSQSTLPAPMAEENTHTLPPRSRRRENECTEPGP